MGQVSDDERGVSDQDELIKDDDLRMFDLSYKNIG